MSQVPGSQGSQTPQLSEEEKELALNKAMIAVELAQLGILELEFELAGWLSYPDVSTLRSWRRRAIDGLDNNDLDKALQYTEKITQFLKERQKLCEELRKKNRKHSKRYSSHSSRH